MTESEVWRQAYNAALAGVCAVGEDVGWPAVGNECKGHADEALERYREMQSGRRVARTDD